MTSIQLLAQACMDGYMKCSRSKSEHRNVWFYTLFMAKNPSHFHINIQWQSGILHFHHHHKFSSQRNFPGNAFQQLIFFKIILAHNKPAFLQYKFTRFYGNRLHPTSTTHSPREEKTTITSEQIDSHPKTTLLKTTIKNEDVLV